MVCEISEARAKRKIIHLLLGFSAPFGKPTFLCSREFKTLFL
jgi:hypothetical protein